MDQLQERGRHLANRCLLCGEDEENIDHLLLHCKKVRDLRAFLLPLFGISWNLPCTTRELLNCWRRPPIRKRLKKIWMAAPISLFWTIWQGRNRAIFEEGAFTTQGSKLTFAYTLWSWTKVYPDFELCTMNDFLVILGTV